VKSPGKNSNAENIIIDTATKVIKPKPSRIKTVLMIGCNFKTHDIFGTLTTDRVSKTCFANPYIGR
jgi:hypothetical protein